MKKNTKNYKYALGYSSNQDDPFCYIIRIHSLKELESLVQLLHNCGFTIHGITNSDADVKFSTDFIKKGGE